MITRRNLLKTLALGALAGSWSGLSRTKSASGEDRPREFQWRVPKVHLESVKNALRFKGAVSAAKDEKGAVLAFVFIGSAFLPYLAKAILSLRRDMVNGGIVIDTRGEKIDIDTDKSLPGGVIVATTPIGSQLYERDEIGDPAELVSALRKGLK
jgi:hypothetical protein